MWDPSLKIHILHLLLGQHRSLLFTHYLATFASRSSLMFVLIEFLLLLFFFLKGAHHKSFHLFESFVVVLYLYNLIVCHKVLLSRLCTFGIIFISFLHFWSFCDSYVTTVHPLNLTIMVCFMSLFFLKFILYFY